MTFYLKATTATQNTERIDFIDNFITILKCLTDEKCKMNGSSYRKNRSVSPAP